MMTITPPPPTLTESDARVDPYTAAPAISCRYCDDGILFRVVDRFVPTTRAYVRVFRCDRCGAGAVHV